MHSELKNIKLIVGLGNPGPTYAHTFHNVGMLFLNYLKGKSTWKRRALFVFAPHGEHITLVAPRTFMNESGRAVRAAARGFRVSPEEILIAHDDSDITLGNYKLSWNRGAAGHKGVVSTAATLRTERFWRARIGIRKEKGRAGEFVLTTIGVRDKKKLYRVFAELKRNVSVNEKSGFTS